MLGRDRDHDRADDEQLVRRLCQVCQELFGDVDSLTLAAMLKVPVREIEGLRAGHTMSAELLLQLIEATSLRPGWLLTGVGEKFLPPRSLDWLSSVHPNDGPVWLSGRWSC